MPEIIRNHYIFYGDVQGVGFRWRACQAAKIYGITGWVQNLSDGTVEMEAEGIPCDIDNMLEMLENGSYIDIIDIDVKPIPVENSRTFEYDR